MASAMIAENSVIFGFAIGIGCGMCVGYFLRRKTSSHIAEGMPNLDINVRFFTQTVCILSDNIDSCHSWMNVGGHFSSLTSALHEISHTTFLMTSYASRSCDVKICLWILCGVVCHQCGEM